MDTPVLADQQKTYIIQLSVNPRCFLDDLPRAMIDWSRWLQKESKDSVLLPHLDNVDDDDDDEGR